MSARLVGALLALVALVGASGCTWNERQPLTGPTTCWTTTSGEHWCGDLATGNGWRTDAPRD